MTAAVAVPGAEPKPPTGSHPAGHLAHRGRHASAASTRRTTASGSSARSRSTRASSSTPSAQSTDGDLKAEYWGDGRSFATSLSYTNATSYLTIFGGWHNKFHVLARLNEHGSDRKEITIDPNSDDIREKPVDAGQIYHFKVERTDGKTVKWSIDGNEMLTYPDARPLAGAGARPLRLQRLGREGLLRQRQSRASALTRSAAPVERAREIEKYVGDLEIAVDRLRSLYEQYFMGIEKLEPTVPRKDVDRRIQVLRKEQIRNTAQRFRFQMILQRYNTYQTHWLRICREIENGTYKRHLLKAQAAASETARSKPARRRSAGPPPEPRRCPAPPGTARSREPRRRAGRARRGLRAHARAHATTI